MHFPNDLQQDLELEEQAGRNPYQSCLTSLLPACLKPQFSKT